MISRRTFLKWGTAVPITLALPTTGGASGTTAQNTIVVLDDLTPETDIARTAIVLDALTRKGLPVTCVVDPTLFGQSAPGSTSNTLISMLRTRLERSPGLIEVVPLAPNLGRMTPYFQARAAYEAGRSLQELLGNNSARKAFGMASQTVACDLLESPIAPSGVRAAGIRNVLMRPQRSTNVRPEAWEDGVARMVGGQRVQLQQTSTPYSLSQPQAVERVYYLSAQDFSAIPTSALEAAATAFASQVLRQTGDHWVSPILASDIQFRDAYAYRRNVGLHFILPRNADGQSRDDLLLFQQELMNEGRPSSFGLDTSSDPAAGYWVTLQETSSPSDPIDMFAHRQKTPPIPPSSTPEGVYGVAAKLSAFCEAGLTAQNVLSLPAIFIEEASDLRTTLDMARGTGDRVLVVSAELVQSRAHRIALKNALHEIEHDGISNLVSLPTYVRHIVPTGPYITHHRRTQAYKRNTSEAPSQLSDEARGQLLADAKVAWSYFEQWTNPKTGLCPATASFAPGQRRLHEAVTMWDVGSHIFALMAAADLGLITPKKFQSSIRRILPNLAGRRSQGRLLPQGWIVTNKFKWGNRDFDGCDAGRLLSALYNLEMHPLGKDLAAPTVEKWDLKDIVKDGIIYSVENGQLETTFRSHCAHYAAWAFRTWGIEVASPYEVFQGRSPSDGQMALLEVCGHIGPLGAEPLLMEAVEFGMSPESAYLADVLFAAQLEEFKETGRTIAVSETPINSDPWFVYQGLQFDAPGRVWATDTVASLEAHRTEEFRDRHLSISSKAAYLWASYSGHPFCDKLLDLVRNTAKTPYGFASSINQRTGEAPSTYSDLNTNAVILQSIAAMLETGSNPD